MKRLNHKISIGGYSIGSLMELSINESRDTFTDTGEITLVNRVYTQNKKLTDLLKVGDAIKIELGYFPNLVEVFNGYISKVNPDSPSILKFEDESWILKQKTIGKYSRNQVNLSDLIGDLYDGEVDILDVFVGDWRVDQNSTLIGVLDKLKDTFGILSYFRNGILYVNKEVDEIGNDIVLHFQRNVPEGSGNGLDFQNKTDLNIVSAGVSVQANGAKIERYAFYEDVVNRDTITVTNEKPIGNINLFKVPNLSASALIDLIKQRLPKLYYTGVTGNVDTFGEPYIKHGDNIHVIDLKYPEKNGVYKCISVKRTFGNSGYRQNIELGIKVGDISQDLIDKYARI